MKEKESNSEQILTPEELKDKLFEFSKSRPTVLIIGNTKYETNHTGYTKTDIDEEIEDVNLMFVNGAKPIIHLFVHEYTKLYLSKTKNE